MKHTIKLLLSILLLLSVELIYARAGGGSFSGWRGGFGSSIILYLLAPFVIIFLIVKLVLIRIKKNKAHKILDKIVLEDQIWDIEYINQRVSTVFFKVQEAWMKRNQNISKNYMSERIFQKHKIQTDKLIEKGWINILKDIRLIQSTIISVKDFNNDNKDSFSALIKAEMIDYHINEKSKQVVDGIPYRAQKFEEIWNFIRIDNNWVLDEIYNDLNARDIIESKSYKEKSRS
jgi:hypothetical protein